MASPVPTWWWESLSQEARPELPETDLDVHSELTRRLRIRASLAKRGKRPGKALSKPFKVGQHVKLALLLYSEKLLRGIRLLALQRSSDKQADDAASDVLDGVAYEGLERAEVVVLDPYQQQIAQIVIDELTDRQADNLRRHRRFARHFREVIFAMLITGYSDLAVLRVKQYCSLVEYEFRGEFSRQEFNKAIAEEISSTMNFHSYVPGLSKL